MDRYDIGIIGSGPGGYKAALKAAKENKKVCIIEKNMQTVGGVCLNEGCIPTKSLIDSVNTLNLLSKADKCGIEVDVKKIDIQKIIGCSQESIKRLKQGLLYLFKKNNIELIEGYGKISDEKHIEIETEKGNKKIQADNIIIAAGSHPRVISDIKFDGKSIITSAEAVKLEKIPESILIVGGGAIGVEFASIYNSLGLKVTIIEMTDSLLPQEDKEIVNQLIRNFNKKNVNVLVESKVEGVSLKNNKIIAKIKNKENEYKNLEAECILIAAGRVPNTENLGLNKLGIELDEGGFIKVDKNMETSVANIYAVGDVTNSPLLAHVAFKEAEVAVDTILGRKTFINYENVPMVVYSKPEIASVGFTEEQVKQKDYEYKVGRYFYRSNGRAVVSHNKEGMVKIIIDDKSKKILGAHIIGVDASEIIHEYIIAKQNNLGIEKIYQTIHAHPTLSEMAVDVSESLI